MNPFCPNLSNHQINNEFNELIDSFLSLFDGDRDRAEKMAYYLWSKNEGYSIDKAPDGEPSKLFQSHLEALNGDRKEAIRQTAKDVLQGRSHDDVMLQLRTPQVNPMQNMKETIDEIGLYSLIETLVSQGISRDVAIAIYKTVRKYLGIFLLQDRRRYVGEFPEIIRL